MSAQLCALYLIDTWRQNGGCYRHCEWEEHWGNRGPTAQFLLQSHWLEVNLALFPWIPWHSLALIHSCVWRKDSTVEITSKWAAAVCLDKSVQILEHPSLKPVKWTEWDTQLLKLESMDEGFWLEKTETTERYQSYFANTKCQTTRTPEEKSTPSI